MKQQNILAILFGFLFFCMLPAQAQRVYTDEEMEKKGYQIDPNMKVGKDSTKVDVEIPAPKLYSWTVSKNLGNIIPVDVDTLAHNFQNEQLTSGMKGHYNYLGNLNSPRINRLYMDRSMYRENIFLQPYSYFIINPEQVHFTNSNIPYTNLTYFKAGNKQYGEENFKSYFSINATKDLSFGFRFNYLIGRGYYADQSTKGFNGMVFSSYRGERYQLHAVYTSNYLETLENGGIEDDKYITDPQSMAEGKRSYETMNIPTNMTSTWNNNRNAMFYLSHRYNIGFAKKVAVGIEDSTKAKRDSLGRVLPVFRKEYIPVTSFIHTLSIERDFHRFVSRSEAEDQYDYTYISHTNGLSNDTTRYLGIRNTIGLNLMEGFNRYAKAGLTAFVTHKYDRYLLMGEEAHKEDIYKENRIYIGGELRKTQGSLLHYTLWGQAGIGMDAIGEAQFKGDLDCNVPLWGDTLTVKGLAQYNRLLPNFYLRHYHGTHFWWDQDLDTETRMRLGGSLQSHRWGTKLSFAIENITNYAYFGQTGIAQQYDDNIQMLQAQLTQNFKLGIFHWDNELTYQKSSKQEIIPVPDFSLYSNFYIKTAVAKKVLKVRLGADVRYFTSYKAPYYVPGISNYALQPDNDQVDIGNYPIVNLYANLRLKRTRIFVQAYHVNQSTGNYFLVPHYPINQMLFKFGLSWNFYD